MRKAIAAATALLVLGGVNYEIMATERVLREGRIFYLKLAPVDPRSLMQGDYMALNYDIANLLRGNGDTPAEGWVRLQIGPNLVADQPVVWDGSALTPDQVRLRFRRDGWRVSVGSNAYFFEEGQAARYAAAEYGMYRTDGSGKTLLVQLVNARLQPL